MGTSACADRSEAETIEREYQNGQNTIKERSLGIPFFKILTRS